MIVGYARTSTVEQVSGLSAQLRDLQSAGCERVFSEHVSSVAERIEFDRAMDFVREGDALVVTKPDRLARNTGVLLEVVARLERKGCALVVLSLGGERLDTRNPTSKLILTIMGGIAAWEREIMLERQREGIAAAKAAGLYRGRAPTAMRKSDEVLAMIEAGARKVDIARDLGIGIASVYRIAAGARAGEVVG